MLRPQRLLGEDQGLLRQGRGLGVAALFRQGLGLSGEALGLGRGLPGLLGRGGGREEQADEKNREAGEQAALGHGFSL